MTRLFPLQRKDGQGLIYDPRHCPPKKTILMNTTVKDFMSITPSWLNGYTLFDYDLRYDYLIRHLYIIL